MSEVKEYTLYIIDINGRARLLHFLRANSNEALLNYAIKTIQGKYKSKNDDEVNRD